MLPCFAVPMRILRLVIYGMSDQRIVSMEHNNREPRTCNQSFCDFLLVESARLSLQCTINTLLDKKHISEEMYSSPPRNVTYFLKIISTSWF